MKHIDEHVSVCISKKKNSFKNSIICASTFNNGRYTCVASNPAGSVNMTIDIRVQASKSTGLIIIHTYFVSIECGFSRYPFLSLNIRRCIKS